MFIDIIAGISLPPWFSQQTHALRDVLHFRLTYRNIIRNILRCLQWWPLQSHTPHTHTHTLHTQTHTDRLVFTLSDVEYLVWFVNITKPYMNAYARGMYLYECVKNNRCAILLDNRRNNEWDPITCMDGWHLALSTYIVPEMNIPLYTILSARRYANICYLQF